MEWQAYEDSLCSGCRQERDQSFAPEMDDRYDVEVLVCHACAARERKAHARADANPDHRPFGEYYVVTPEEG